MGLSCRIENDGSLTVYNESTCLIKNMYPGIDGHPVHALQIIREDKRVVWVTAHGNIACRLPEADENCFALEYALENYEVPVHTIHFFLLADIQAEGFYQAAEGMGKDTGYYGKEEILKKGTLLSYGLCSLQYEPL